MSTRSPTVAVRDLCLAFGDTEYRHSHGLPDFRVNGKVFAQYAVNHHGDGRVALWLNSPEGVQQDFVAMDSESYFVPPYVGPRGWLGINLDKNLSWDEVQYQVAQAYLNTSRRNADIEDVIPDVPPPDIPIDPVEFDAFNDPSCRRCLEQIRSFCFSLPEVSEVPQFGRPSFKAGKKTFVSTYVRNRTPCVEIWVGKEQQTVLVADSRFTIPRYTGHNGWIQLALRDQDCMELFQDLAIASYRHFALKRMLTKLDEDSV